MKKSFLVSVDITVCKNFFVDAESEEQAKSLVEKKMTDDPYYYAKNSDTVVDWFVSSVDED